VRMNTQPLCDLCHARPASHQVTVTRNGEERLIHLCTHDFARLQHGSLSPFDLLQMTDVRHVTGGHQQQPVDITEYLSEHARQLLRTAGQIAAEHGRSEMDTEHLLVSLLESPVVIRVFEELKLDPTVLRTQLLRDMSSEGGEVSMVGISPRCKGVVNDAFALSQEMGHQYIGPEHLLIALLREEQGVAGQALRALGLGEEQLRQRVLQVVGKGAEDGSLEATASTTPLIDSYSRDLTKLAKQGKLDPVIGRADEIESAVEILSRRTKNNPVFIGEPGVGKTAVAEGLAQRIVSGSVPETLVGKRLVELSLTSLVAGTKFRGEFEERINKLLEEMREHGQGIILFIDELHTIIGAGGGGSEGGLDAANTLKPALARGELRLIGATTLSEYQKHIEKDSALERRFQPVYVGEPSPEDAVHILFGLRDKYEAHHKVRITDDAIQAAVDLSDRYITNRFLPDKAIDLVDQAAARVHIAHNTVSRELKTLQGHIETLKREQESARALKDEDRAKDLAEKRAVLEAQYSEQETAWLRKRGVESAQVDVADIAAVVAKQTGVPVTELTQEERERLLALEEKLKARVIGQDEAVKVVADAVRIARAGLAERHKPIATLLFLGPTGVGKTELAKALAASVYGDERALVRIDMSEYGERHTTARLFGAPPGYVGHDEGGQLTEAIRRRPHSVVLLDELEKAHPEVYNTLLQVFDDGRLTDGKGRTVDFSNTIIIATSNLGTELYEKQSSIGFSTGMETVEQQSQRAKVLAALKDHFRPEFINRLDEIIVFNRLDSDAFAKIVLLALEDVKKRVADKGITVQFDQTLIDHLVEVGSSSHFGARELKRTVKQVVEKPLSTKLLGGEIAQGSQVGLSWTEEKLDIAVVMPELQPA